jgi:hypothetical protein
MNLRFVSLLLIMCMRLYYKPPNRFLEQCAVYFEIHQWICLEKYVRMEFSTPAQCLMGALQE